jgi:hypothetical protein
MNESEWKALTPEERERRVTEIADLITLEHARELLTLEGWEFVAINNEMMDEPGYDPETDDSEIWRREVGGRTEWCDLFRWPLPIAPERSQDESYCCQFWPIDPRLIEV